MNRKHSVQTIYKRKIVFMYVPKIVYMKYYAQKL